MPRPKSTASQSRAVDKWSLPAQQARSKATRGKLLSAAEKVFAEQGYDGAKLSDIAEEAGVSVGAVYFRFKDKDALFQAIAETFTGEVRARMNVVASGPPEEIIRGFVMGSAAQMRAHRGLFRAILERGFEKGSDTIFAVRDEFAAALERALDRRRGDLAVRVMTQMVYGFLIAGVLNHKAPTRIGDARAIAELANACVAYFRGVK
ncbi:MAG: TetR/AcrR family transcriptional regulator [Alphaproteobacteria bacterium]|nr:TetR/AcrR family transcriptional regulator [Alphaproteobacteria bacterium]